MNSMKKIFLMISMAAIALSIACTDDSGDIINLPPGAVIIAPDMAGLNEEVTLNGSQSLDPEGESITYAWSFISIPTGSSASITNANQATASFTTDVEGSYVVSLAVSDGTNSNSDQVTIFASAGSVPMVRITDTNGSDFGDEMVFRPNEEFTLTGAFTTDLEDGTNLSSYEWAFTTQPAGSVATPTTSTTAETTFALDLVGDYVLELTVTDSDGNEGKAEVMIKVDRIPILITANVDANMTLENVYEDPQFLDYLVTKTILSVNADLTVMPGVSVGFEDDHGLFVNVNGSLSAVGTASDSIVFRGESGAKGSWRGIGITSNNTANKFQFVKLTDAGSDGFDGAGILANLIIEDDGKIAVSNSRIENGAGTGVYVRSLASQLTDFSNNAITENVSPVTCSINDYHFLKGNTDYSGNTNDYIVSITGSTTSENVTWGKLNVPYKLADRVQFIGSAITVEAGAQFLGQSGSGLEITTSGSLDATGTANEIISFTGEQDTEGVWRGLNFQSNNASNKLIYCEVSHGGQEGFDGANLKSNVIVEGNGRLIIQFSSITQSADVGVYLRNNTSKLPDFASNTMTDNAFPVRMAPANWHFLDSESDYTGNTNDFIDGFWSNGTQGSTVTWQALNVPYRLADNLERWTQGGITIEAGVNITSRADGGIEIEEDAFMTIAGTLSNPVTMRGDQNVTGYWRGIRFNSNNASNMVTNLNISNGGSRGFDGANRKANIEIGPENGLANLSNVSSSLSGGYGIRVQDGGTLISTGLTFSGNVLTGNQDGGGTQNDN